MKVSTALKIYYQWSIQKTVVHLHNGILHSREKEAPTLYDSIDGTGEHYAKWNKPGGKRQIPHDLTFNWDIICLLYTSDAADELITV